MNPSANKFERAVNAVDWEQAELDAPNSPLAQCGAGPGEYSGPDLQLRELNGVALLRLHSLQSAEELNSALDAVNIQLPAQPLNSHGIDPSALSLAPGEWLLFSEFLGADRLSETLNSVLDGQHSRVLDLSPGHAVFRLEGRSAPWLLGKLCALDVFRMNPDEPCAMRTRIQEVAVTLHYHSPGGRKSGPVFDLICDRSMTRYLWQLLIASIPHAEQLLQLYGKPE